MYIISDSTPGGHFIATGYDKGETCELPMPELTALEYQLQLGLFSATQKAQLKLVLTPSTETLTLICASITFRVNEILSRLARLSYYHFTGRDKMATAKEHISEIIKRQPEDSSYDEIVRELAFDLMVQRGLKDSDARRTISNEEMQHRIETWQK